MLSLTAPLATLVTSPGSTAVLAPLVAHDRSGPVHTITDLSDGAWRVHDRAQAVLIPADRSA